MKERGKKSRYRPDWQVLLISFGAAAAFWFFNALKHTYTTSIAYPLEIRYDHEKYFPEEPLPNEIIFTATGTGWDLLRRKFKPANEPLYINYEKIRQKNFITSDVLTPLLTQKLNGLLVQGYEEDTVLIKLSKLRTRKLKLSADIRSVNFEEGYYVTDEPRCNPGWVTARGTAKQLKRIPDTLWVKVAGNTDAAGNFSEEGIIELPGEGVVLEVKSSVVTFQTSPHLKVKREINVKKVNFPSNDYILSAKTISVEYYIEEKYKNRDGEVPYVAVVDYKKWDRRDNRVKVRLQPMQPYLKGLKISPDQVSVSQ